MRVSNFWLEKPLAKVWLDDVRLAVRPPDVYQREVYQRDGLLNGSQEPQEITIDPGYGRLQANRRPAMKRFWTIGSQLFLHRHLDINEI